MAFTASDWGRGVLLTGLTPSATLSGYVALISLDNVPVESIDAGANSAINGGGDLRFSTDIDGINQLPLEVVSFVTNATPGSRVCQLWVRFPTYAIGTREVYMFYKKTGETQPAVGASFGRNAVWQDYSLAAHDIDTNSTGGGNAINVVAGNVIGKIGLAKSFNGSNQYIDFPSSVLQSNEFTISLWEKTNSGTGYFFSDGSNFQNLFARRATSTTVTGQNGQIDWASGGAPFASPLGVYNRLIVTQDSAGNTVVYSDNATVEVTTTGSDFTGLTANLFVGNRGDLARDFNGDIDELTIRDSALPSDHISSEFHNQNDPAAFWVTGAPFTPVGGVTVTANYYQILMAGN